MALKLHTAAPGDGAGPVSLADAKLHLRVDGNAEDALITMMIDAATLEAEHIMGRAILPQKWQLTLDAFADALVLNRPPVTAVDSVKYVHADTGVLTTLDVSSYQLANASDYVARLTPAYGLTWPSTRAQPEAVQVVFTCGYADASKVPAPIKAWIKLRLGALYLHREAWTAGSKIERNEHVDFMLDGYRTWRL